MNKGLEALKEKYLKLLNGTNTPISMEETLLFNEIEKELKEKEELAQALSIITCENGDLLKYKKALEIIKNKNVEIDLLKKSENAVDYNKWSRNVNQSLNLNDMEYDLLKEVLL